MARAAVLTVPPQTLDIGLALADILAPLRHPERVGEKQWEGILERVAPAYGWAHMRVQAMRMKDRWLTGTTARGWPDLTLVRPPWIVFLELKGGGAYHVDPDQKTWIARLQACGPNVAAYIVRPQDAQKVLDLLADPDRFTSARHEPGLGSDP